MNETDKLIDEQFKTLPPNIQEAIKAMPWKSTVKEIALLNKLDLKKVAIVEMETMFVLYGFESPDDYIENLTREAQINEETATIIAESVAKKILEPISIKSEQLKEEEKEPPKTLDMKKVKTGIPEIAPEIHPMVEEGEVAHDVPHTENKPETPSIPLPNKPQTPKAPLPDYRYSNGKDPYREPIE